MILNYEVAKVNIRIETDFDVLQSQASPLFLTDSESFDVKIDIHLGDANIKGKKVFSGEFSDVIETEDGEYVTVYYGSDNKTQNFILRKSDNGYSCILNSQCPQTGRDMYCFWGYINLPSIFIERKKLLLHCSYIIYNGKAILFCGKSGIGKSTQAELWKKYAGAEIINGDKAVVYSENGTLYASSLPIAGSSGICSNKTAEVAAIVLLEQSDGNEVMKTTYANGVVSLLSNCLFDVWKEYEINKAIDICSEVCSAANVIRYRCTPDKSAVDCLKVVI